MIGECGTAGVLCVTPPRVIAQGCRPRQERAIARITRGERRVNAVAQGARSVGWRRLVEKDQAASLFALELGPTGATRFIALIEERPREEGRTFLVVADDETVLGCAAQTEDQRRKAAVDRFFRAVEDQRAHLVVVWRRLWIQSNTRGTGRTLERRGIARRCRQRIPRRLVDRRRERRARGPHEPVVFRTGRERERVWKRRVVAFAEPERPDFLEDAALGQAAISGKACFKIVQACNVTHLLASTREGIRAA